MTTLRTGNRALRNLAHLIVLLLLALATTHALAQSGDSDGDGIADEYDECPTRAEDFDGHEDSDGCPDVDTAVSTAASGAPIPRVRNENEEPLETLARDFVALLNEPHASALVALLPTVAEVQWAVTNIVPEEYRQRYPDYYSNPTRMHDELIASSREYEYFEQDIVRWKTVTPKLPLERAVYAGHEPTQANDAEKADGISHRLDVDIDFAYDGFGSLRYRTTLFVMQASDRAALVEYRLFEPSDELPWPKPTAATDAFASSIVDVLRRGDRDGFQRDFFPTADVRGWYLDNRTSPDERELVAEDMADEYFVESFNEAATDLFAAVEEILPDAARMELLRYAPLNTEYGEDGVMLEVRTPSIPRAVFGVAALQGPDKFYYMPYGTSISTDPEDLDEDAWPLDFTLHKRYVDMSLAERDADARARAEMHAACPGFKEAVSTALEGAPAYSTRAQPRRDVIDAVSTVLSCQHAEALLDNSYRRVLEEQAEALIWLATEASTDLSDSEKPQYLRRGIDALAAAVDFVQRNPSASEMMSRGHVRRISRTIASTSRDAFNAGVRAQQGGEDELSYAYFTASAAGCDFLDPTDSATREIRGYAGYYAGVSALNNEAYDDARRFLPLVVPPDPELLDVSEAELQSALFLDAPTSADLYYNLGAVTFNHAWEKYEAMTPISADEVSELTPLLNRARVSLTLAKRLDPTHPGVDSAAAEVEELANELAEVR